MSRHEERTYRVGKKRLGIPELKAQRERLRQDLEQFASRNPGAAVIASLRERLRGLDQEIAEAEANRERERSIAQGDDGPDAEGRPRPRQATSSRFPPRGSSSL